MVNEYKKSKLIYIYISEAYRRDKRKGSYDRERLSAHPFPPNSTQICSLFSKAGESFDKILVASRCSRPPSVVAIASHFARLNSEFESCRRLRRKNRRTYSQMRIHVEATLFLPRSTVNEKWETITKPHRGGAESNAGKALPVPRALRGAINNNYTNRPAAK